MSIVKSEEQEFMDAAEDAGIRIHDGKNFLNGPRGTNGLVYWPDVVRLTKALMDDPECRTILKNLVTVDLDRGTVKFTMENGWGKYKIRRLPNEGDSYYCSKLGCSIDHTFEVP